MPDRVELDNYWYYGEAGVGKSRMAREKFGDSLYSKCLNKWFDDYKDEDTILLDDFGKSHNILGDHLKRWSDIYPFQVEEKGASYTIRPKRIVVTSNYHPRDIWADKEGMIDPLTRRFKIIKLFKAEIIQQI